MSQILSTALDAKVGINTVCYDSLFCKTCQKKCLDDPQSARTLYSYCEKHYRLRIKKLRLTGVYVI
jgi:ferredoxin